MYLFIYFLLCIEVNLRLFMVYVSRVSCHGSFTLNLSWLSTFIRYLECHWKDNWFMLYYFIFIFRLSLGVLTWLFTIYWLDYHFPWPECRHSGTSNCAGRGDGHKPKCARCVSHTLRVCGISHTHCQFSVWYLVPHCGTHSFTRIPASVWESKTVGHSKFECVGQLSDKT